MTSLFSNICDKICHKLLNLYLCFAILFGYNIVSKNDTSSFIFDEKNVNIKLYEVSKDIDTNNLIKYLRHHIMQTDDEFYPKHFEVPLFVKFGFQNEVYQICLSRIYSKKTDHSVSLKEPRILSAILKHHENDEDDEGISITEQLVEFHGPDRNFFSHIPDAISDISILLASHGGKELHIFDMLGNKKIHTI
jgi:hypothetical protein